MFFYLIQEWGESQQFSPNDEFEIGNILENDTRWTSIDDYERRKIGKYIAHNFPILSAICTIPIYVVLDPKRTLENGKRGTYRLVKYEYE